MAGVIWLFENISVEGSSFYVESMAESGTKFGFISYRWNKTAMAPHRYQWGAKNLIPKTERSILFIWLINPTNLFVRGCY